MKVLIATPLYPPETGGPATYARELEEELPRRGIETEVLPFTRVRGMPTIVRHIAYFFQAFAACARADLVLALDPLSVGLPAMLAARLSGKPFVVKIVGDFAWEQGRQHYGIALSLDDFVRTSMIPWRLWVLRVIQREVALAARRIIVPSRYLCRIVSAWGVESAKISVIYNAVAPIQEAPVPAAIAALPRPVVLTVGRLVPWKGNSELIDALKSVRVSRPVSLAIVGEGPERTALEAKAVHTLGHGYVFTGALSRAEALSAMRHADVYVLDSLYEGLSHTLVEARMAGAAIVASDRGGNPEVVRDGESGLLVEAENSAALASAIERLLADDALRARLKENARRVSDDFSTARMVEKTVSLLTSLV